MPADADKAVIGRLGEHTWKLPYVHFKFSSADAGMTVSVRLPPLQPSAERAGFADIAAVRPWRINLRNRPFVQIMDYGDFRPFAYRQVQDDKR